MQPRPKGKASTGACVSQGHFLPECSDFNVEENASFNASRCGLEILKRQEGDTFSVPGEVRWLRKDKGDWHDSMASCAHHGPHDRGELAGFEGHNSSAPSVPRTNCNGRWQNGNRMK